MGILWMGRDVISRYESRTSLELFVFSATMLFELYSLEAWIRTCCRSSEHVREEETDSSSSWLLDRDMWNVFRVSEFFLFRLCYF